MKLGFLHWRSEKISLTDGTAQCPYDRAFGLRLDPFRNDPDVQRGAEFDDALHDDALGRAMGNVMHKASIDFDFAKRKTLQITQIGKARAEVIDRDTDTQPAQIPEDAADTVRIRNHQVLGELQRQPFGSATGLFERLLDTGNHVALGKFEHRYVQGEADRHATIPVDLRRMDTDRAKTPGADFHERAGFFRDPDEPAGRLQTKGPVVPTQKRLGPDQNPGAEVNLRLVVKQQFLIGNARL